MPRVSASALQTLELVDKTSTVEAIRRVRPPPELTPEQSEEFERVVATMPAEWFVPANVSMLAQYARHVVMARRIGELIEAMISGEVEDMKGLGQIAEGAVAKTFHKS